MKGEMLLNALKKELTPVKKQVLPVLLLATLLMACSTKPAPPQSEPPATQAPGATTPPVTTTPEPTKPPEPVQPPKAQVDPVQAMGWYEHDIGYPMRSDDPKAADLKVAMLTFDDGPTKITPQILDTLKQEQIRAIFFVTGYSVDANPEILKRIAAEGHVIGLHTMTHPVLSDLSQAEQRAEIEPLITKVKELTGITPKYIRPPHGAYNQDLLDLCAELGLIVTNWSNGSLDWEGVDSNGYKDPQLVLEAVLEQLHPGSNILMHDTHQHTANAVPMIIKALREKGYQFVTLGKE